MQNAITRKQRGFTLIELMVGMALGLLASLAIFTAVTSFETQRRVTAAGADMQQNGLLALYFLEQDLRMAGFGLIDASTDPGRLHRQSSTESELHRSASSMAAPVPMAKPYLTPSPPTDLILTLAGS